MTEIKIVDPSGRTIPYVDEGEGPVVLALVAEGGLDGDALGVVAHYLAEEAGFRVVRIGAATVADVVAVLDHLGLEHTWIGGHGTGGTVARAFAAAHIDRVNGLLLLGVEDEEIALAPVIPVLIIQGADDDITPPENGLRLQATAPERASITNIDGADHRFPMTHPVETAVVIEEYLDWD